MRRKLILIITFAILILTTTLPLQAAGAPTDVVLEVINGQLTIYDRPTPVGTVVASLPVGARVSWSGQSQQAQGRKWIQVNTGSVTGWTAPDNEALIIADPSRVTYQMDRSVTFQNPQNNLVLYRSPDFNSGAVGSAPINSQLTVTDGPAFTEFYTWWQVKTATGAQGWIADTAKGLQVITPLKVYGYNVCDGFNLKAFGVAGWDSIVSVLPTLIAPQERVICLASTNLKGDKTPIVVVLTRIQGTQPSETQDTLRIFEQRGAWTAIYQQTAEKFSITDQLSLQNVIGGSKPALMWTVRMDGTGQYLNVRLFQYDPTAGIQPVLSVDSLYKGFAQIHQGGVNLIQADYRDDEPNCCHVGLLRSSYSWQAYRFVKVIDDRIANPYFLQGIPKS